MPFKLIAAMLLVAFGVAACGQQEEPAPVAPVVIAEPTTSKW